jgi:hypothetical protein
LRRLYRDGTGGAEARRYERDGFTEWVRTRLRDAVSAGTVRAVIERGRAQQR